MNNYLNEIIDNDKSYYMNTFGDRTPLCFQRGDGVKLYTNDGEEYYDFFAGIAVSALGHSHPAFVADLKDQIGKIIHTSSVYYIENQANLAKELCTRSCFDKVFFANSGAEANEGAIKLARKYFFNQKKEKFEIITLNKSFHGRTITTATATGQEKYKEPYKPLTPGFKHVEINDIYALKSQICEKTCAIMLELIQGESGVHPVNKEYIKEVRKICDQNEILLIVDEVQTGIGRTGKMFAYENYGIEPDIITLAKALGGGVPIGAVLAKDFVASAFNPGDHGTTFGGNPLSTRAGLSVLKVIDDEKLIENSKIMGDYFAKKLADINSEMIKEVRGMGLMIGIELSCDIAGKVKDRLMEKHILVGACANRIIRVLPPLIISKNDIDIFADALKNILKEFEK